MAVIINGTTGITDVNGTAAAPAITGTDTDTGMFFGTNIVSLATNGAERVTLDASGNLLVGGTAQVFGEKLLLKTASGDCYTTMSNGTGSVYVGWSNSGFGFMGTATNHAQTFYTNGSERARIDSSGNLLVGKTTYNSSSSGLNISNIGGTYGRIDCVKTVSGTVDALANYYAGTYVGGITYSNTATALLTSSDSRLKKDIADAGSASAKIDQIRIVSHGWKHDDDVVEFGVIAQELNLVVPQAVNAGDEGEEIEKTWGVDYSKLVPILIKAHQELKAEFDAYKAAHP
jgi:hypothetical protein